MAMDPRARFKDRKPSCTVQCAVNQEILSHIQGQVLTAPERVFTRGTKPCLFGKGGTCCHVCNSTAPLVSMLLL